MSKPSDPKGHAQCNDEPKVPVAVAVAPPATAAGLAADLTSTIDVVEDAGGFFRGLAAAVRSSFPTLIAAKQGVRALGETRSLAFASEGGVAAQTLIPKYVYYGAWGLSGAAIMADVATKTMDAKEEKRYATAIYHTLFHIPASLIVPAVIIHQVVHGAQKLVAKAPGLPPRAKMMLPVTAALLAIIPVVPVVDHLAEAILEPTLGEVLGVEFHHAGNHADDDGGQQKTKTE